MLVNILFICLSFLGICLPLLVGVSLLTLVERKVMGSMQCRRGPNVVGFFGLLQPIADGFKLILKETVVPGNSNFILFLIAPVITFSLSLLNWLVLPVLGSFVIYDTDISVLFLLSISSLGVYGLILSGWSSGSQYGFLGSLRSTAQMISYEISLGLIILSIALSAGSLNLNQIVYAQSEIWFIIPFFPLFIIFFISSLAETNRAPFDLPEAEAELVSGYNVEYSSMGFALFFLGEYSNIIFMSCLNVILFFGGWLPILKFFYFIPPVIWFSLKVFFLCFLFVWVRASFPRYRFDQLMNIGWKVILPISLSIFFFNLVLFNNAIWL